MKKLTVSIGDKFGILTVVRLHEMKDWHKTWACICKCGREITYRQDSLLLPRNKFNRCLCSRRKAKELGLTGVLRSKVYIVWKEIVRRCTNVNHHAYEYYGGRGITICDEWLDFENFFKWSVENGYSDNLQIDRIRNGEGYKTDNCRFVDRRTNMANRRNSIYVTINGVRKSLLEWSDATGIRYDTLYQRYRRSIPASELLNVKQRRLVQ